MTAPDGDDYQILSALEQVERRRKRTEELLRESGAGHLTAEERTASVMALMREQLAGQRARRAERAGQLDLGGTA